MADLTKKKSILYIAYCHDECILIFQETVMLGLLVRYTVASDESD